MFLVDCSMKGKQIGLKNYFTSLVAIAAFTVYEAIPHDLVVAVAIANSVI